MTVKELAYAAQQHIQTSTASIFKRAHIYELLATSFGYNSYAALTAESVFTDLPPTCRVSLHGEQIQRRCLEIGYLPETAKAVATALPAFLLEREIGVIKFADLIAHWRLESAGHEWYDDEGEDTREDALEAVPSSSDARESTILIDGLNAAAIKGNGHAHYALALVHAPADADDAQGTGSEYWYNQALSGRVLDGIEKEWADAHAATLSSAEKYAHHLREAARLGSQQALLDLAEQFGDPAFFEQDRVDPDVDASAVARIAERMGREEDARRWLTIAAESGNTGAMRELIEEYDGRDPIRCWTWLYLAELMGVDLAKDEHYAINEDGSPYDDDVGGPAFVAGQDGVQLDPLDPKKDAMARKAAQALWAKMQ